MNKKHPIVVLTWFLLFSLWPPPGATLCIDLPLVWKSQLYNEYLEIFNNINVNLNLNKIYILSIIFHSCVEMSDGHNVKFWVVTIINSCLFIFILDDAMEEHPNICLLKIKIYNNQHLDCEFGIHMPSVEMVKMHLLDEGSLPYWTWMSLLKSAWFGMLLLCCPKCKLWWIPTTSNTHWQESCLLAQVL